MLAGIVTAAFAYYFTPKYTRVGYAPIQPVAYSHELHVGRLGLDCRYCHTHVGQAPHANLPTAQVCMNCHDQTKGNIKAQSPALEPLRQAMKTGRPVEWVRVHKLPEFVFFNHSIHAQRGISCVYCHGKVNEMAVVRHDQPMSMSWCLDCHRNPSPNLRPAGEVVNLAWDAAAFWDAAKDPVYKARSQAEFATLLRQNGGIHPPTDCAGCHR
ncbi:MAG TPA: cytochrome c3 family protein [Tepidisphaeraceae bacterium]|nr:cytochrome c3 family protein [Tepidisphaeraceae bacterium]